MPFVEIYKLQHDGLQTVVVTCHMENGEAVCVGDAVFVENLIREGIRDYSSASLTAKLFPKDGRKFLEQLKYNFKSGYMNASDIVED